MSMSIIAVRVQNKQTQKWYSLDNGVWDVNGAPIIPNNTDIYIAFYAANYGQGTHGYAELWCNDSKLGNMAQGITPGQALALEWSGKMTATGNANFIVRAWADNESPSTVHFTIQASGTTPTPNPDTGNTNPTPDPWSGTPNPDSGQIGGGFINKQNVIIGGVAALAIFGGIVYLRNRSTVNNAVKKTYNFTKDKAALAYNYGKYMTKLE